MRSRLSYFFPGDEHLNLQLPVQIALFTSPSSLSPRSPLLNCFPRSKLCVFAEQRKGLFSSPCLYLKTFYNPISRFFGFDRDSLVLNCFSFFGCSSRYSSSSANYSFTLPSSNTSSKQKTNFFLFPFDHLTRTSLLYSSPARISGSSRCCSFAFDLTNDNHLLCFPAPDVSAKRLRIE